MKSKFVIGNFKMNFTLNDVDDYITDIYSNFSDILSLSKNLNLSFAPPYLYLYKFNFLRKFGIKISAQDCSCNVMGAFTSQISAKMLVDFCDYVIVGHSETRKYLKYTNNDIVDKIRNALRFSLLPIVCVGEGLDIRQKEEHLQYIESQLSDIAKEFDKSSVVIAYEPIWAIGTGFIANVVQISQMVNFIKTNLGFKYVLYGGSVKKDNVVDLISIDLLDGVLVGGASLNLKDFIAIAKNFV